MKTQTIHSCFQLRIFITIIADPANNQPLAMKYNNTLYYYVLNAQGDVVRIVDSSRNTVASYTYDPWGKIISSSGTLADINPLRYRGYYYDSETGFYYLQSRYYDPEIGRFINADSYASTDMVGLLSTNMFSYCENNPVMRVDPTGKFWDILDCFMAALSWEEFVSNPSWAGFGWAVADTISLLPGIPSVSYVRRGLEIADTVQDISKSMRRIQDAAETLPRGNNYVYYSLNSNGIIDYVWITNNFERRSAEWARKGRVIQHYVDGVDRTSARYVEQAVIDTFGMKKNGGLLDNKINSIAPKPVTIYERFKRFMKPLI
ncbi:MAG: hypothetical protein BHW36_07360 [Firmicutes bacterium CAG:24053_14]|mgnify:FL=1|jgi:RHS repeat-associated protein|nr:MAG: hypothetical protein BHW36_07360 [Firmicutes bacterium CAG:24053_14]